MYYSIKITSQNRITLPLELRKRWKIIPGTTLYFEALDRKKALMSTKPISAKDLVRFKTLAIPIT